MLMLGEMIYKSAPMNFICELLLCSNCDSNVVFLHNTREKNKQMYMWVHIHVNMSSENRIKSLKIQSKGLHNNINY